MESPDASSPAARKPVLPARVMSVLARAGITPSRVEETPSGYQLPLHDDADGCDDRPVFTFRPAARRHAGPLTGARILPRRRAWDWDASYGDERNPYARPARAARNVPDAGLAEELSAALTAAEMTAVLRRDGISAWLHDHSFDGTRQVTGSLPGGRVFIVHDHGHRWPGENDPLPEELDLSVFPPEGEPAPGCHPVPELWAEDRQVTMSITAARALRDLRALHREEISPAGSPPRRSRAVPGARRRRRQR